MINKIKNLTLTAISATLLASVCAQAQTTINYDTPAADSFVSVFYPDTNYGDETTWRTRFSASTSSQRLGYVRFDLDDLITGQVSDATLSVVYTGRTNATGDETTLTVFGLNHDYTPTSGKLGLDWGELALTNDNAPWAASGSGSVPSIVTTLGSVSIPVAEAPAAGTVYSISTPELISFINTFQENGINDMTFIFRSSGGTFLQFASKENLTYDPTSLSVTIVPESSTLALAFGLAAGWIALLRSRKRIRAS